MASADVLEITVTGKGGHASTPYLANDPMPVAAEIVQALQVLATRRINTFDPVVVTITKIRAGTTDNVIPETVEMQGTLRAVSEHSRRVATDAMRRLVEGIAAAHDMRAELRVFAGYPVTVNDEAAAAFALRVATDLVGSEHAGRMPAPVMGAEDFSYVLQQRAGCNVVPRRVPAGGASGAGVRLSFEPHDDRRRRHAHRSCDVRGDGPRVRRHRRSVGRLITSPARRGG